MIKSMLNQFFKLMNFRRGHLTLGRCSVVDWFKIGRLNGRVVVGEGSIVNCRIDFDSPKGLVAIGDRSYLGASHLVCHTNIEIGHDVIISWGVTIVDHNSHSLAWRDRMHDVPRWAIGQKCWDNVKVAPVKIADRVWVGFGATILKGVTIGEGSVVAAGSMVTRDVPPYCIVGGNPARLIRELEDHER